MITDLDDLRRVLGLVFGDHRPPAPLHLVEGAALVRANELSVAEAARRVHSTAAQIARVASAADPVAELLGGPPQRAEPALETRVRASLGQLVIGRLAETVFEDKYRTFVGTEDLRLQDDRQGRGDTDYLVFDTKDRQVFRINIKFHGSQFRRARELVGLEPDNCFALATYKIHLALRKQDAEHLPYIFVIVGVPGLTGSDVGDRVPENLIHLSAIARMFPRVSGKRDIEDCTVEALLTRPEEFGFKHALEMYHSQVASAQWYVLSARRADALLRELLFDRAYALRVRGFAQNYRGAELDMHFSLSADLRPLDEFLEVLRDSGMPGLVSRLERGTL